MTGPRGPLPRLSWTRALLGLAGLVTLAAGLVVTRLLPGPGPRCAEVSIPAYFYPGPSWTEAVGSSPVPGMMILDITSTGAGGAPNRAYAQAVARAQAAGIQVLGYVSTDYGRRPAAAVQAEVRHYRAWYHVASMFLDEAATGTGALPYYRRLNDYIRDADPSAVVMLNPGTYPSRRYMSLGDVVLAYEGPYARYATLRVPGWVDRYPAARFSHVVYDTPGAHLAAAIRLAAARHAGYVYVTDLAGRNPYRALPGYWAAEDAMVATACPATGANTARAPATMSRGPQASRFREVAPRASTVLDGDPVPRGVGRETGSHAYWQGWC